VQRRRILVGGKRFEMYDPETKEVFESFLSIKKTSEGELPGNFVNQEESQAQC